MLPASRRRNKEVTATSEAANEAREEKNISTLWKGITVSYHTTWMTVFVTIWIVSVLITSYKWMPAHDALVEKTFIEDNESEDFSYEVTTLTKGMKDVAAVKRSLEEYSAMCEGTRHDSLYSTLVYNKAFVAMADLQTSTVTDVNGKEHVYVRGQPKSVADHVLHDNMLYIHRDQGITDTLVHTFVTLMTSEEQLQMQPLIVSVKTSIVAEFVLKCLKEQSHVLLPPNVELSQRRKFVVVSGNTDEPTTYPFFVNGMNKKVHIEHDFLDHPLLQHWFGQNADIMHPKLTPLPIGVDFHTIVKESARECHQTPPEQTLQMIEPMLNVINVKSMLPSYVNLQSVDLHPRFAPGESEEERFDFSQVDWALFPQQKRKADTNSSSNSSDEQGLKWTSFDQLSEMERKLLSTQEVEFGIIIEGASRDYIKQEQYITKECDKNVNMSTDLSQSTFHRIALMTHHDDDDNDKQHNNKKKINSLTLYAPLSEVYLHALRQSGFGNPALRKTKVLLTFSEKHFRYLRLPVINYLARHFNDFAVDGRVKRNKMWSMMRRYAFIASAPGAGYDCHRTWEALTLGCIPIVVHPSQYVEPMHEFTFRHHRNGVNSIDVNASLQLYDDLPVVVVNNFETEVNLNSLHKWQTEIHEKNVNGEYNLRKLLSQYWFDRFLGKE